MEKDVYGEGGLGGSIRGNYGRGCTRVSVCQLSGPRRMVITANKVFVIYLDGTTGYQPLTSTAANDFEGAGRAKTAWHEQTIYNAWMTLARGTMKLPR